MITMFPKKKKNNKIVLIYALSDDYSYPRSFWGDFDHVKNMKWWLFKFHSKSLKLLSDGANANFFI